MIAPISMPATSSAAQAGLYGRDAGSPTPARTVPAVLEHSGGPVATRLPRWRGPSRAADLPQGSPRESLLSVAQWTPEAANAWKEAVGAVAKIMLAGAARHSTGQTTNSNANNWPTRQFRRAAWAHRSKAPPDSSCTPHVFAPSARGSILPQSTRCPPANPPNSARHCLTIACDLQWRNLLS